MIRCLPLLLLACGPAKPTTETASDTATTDLWAFGTVHTAIDPDGYVVARGAVHLTQDTDTPGVLTETWFYSDAYETLIDAVTQTVGPIGDASDDVDDAGKLDAFEIRSHLVYLLPRTGGQSEICVRFWADASNYAEPVDLGCETSD